MNTQWYIDVCKKALRNKEPITFFSYSAVLMQAQKEGLIDASWKPEFNWDEVNRLLADQGGVIAGRLFSDYREILKTLDYEGGYEFEEILQLMCKRSSIQVKWTNLSQSWRQFLIEEKKVDLNKLDEQFVFLLNKEQNHVNECRKRSANDLETFLSDHWWWRNEPR